MNNLSGSYSFKFNMPARFTLFTFFIFICFAGNIFGQAVPCNQRVIDNADFTYTGAGPAPSRWNVSQANMGNANFDQAAFSYVASGNFSNVNTNFSGGTNNNTRQYAVVSNPNTLSPQFANISTDGMLVINPLQGQSDQYITYSLGGLVPGNTYNIEIKVWNVIDLAMPNQCQSWCNWNDQLYIDMQNDQPGAQHSNQTGQNWTGTNGSGGWSQGTNQVDKILKISSGGAYAIITGSMTMPANSSSLTITLAKGNSSNPVVLGVDYIKVFGCQQESINVSGGTTSVCEASDLTLTAQGLGPAGSTYQWYQNGTLMPGRTSDTLEVISAIGPGTATTYKAIGTWDNQSVTITSKLCCSSTGGTSDEVLRESFNGLAYTCPTGSTPDGSRHGGYADIPGKGVTNFIDAAYIYAGTGCNSLNDGQYAVVQSSYAGNFWQNRPEVKEHTGASGSGALFINATGNVNSIFYKRDLTAALCQGTRYEFSVWYASLATGAETKPDMEFDVLNGATVVTSTVTGVIPVNEQWYEATVTFVTPTTGASPTYTLQVKNLVGNVSAGNDLMLDDIVVKKCTPFINLYESGTKDSVLSVCDNNPVSLKVTTYYDLPLAVTGSSSGTLYFQWMSSTSPGGPWTLIGTPETTGTFSATPPASGTVYYRAKVSSDLTRAANGQPPLASDCGNDGITTNFKITKGGNFTIPPITGTTAYCTGATMTLTGDPGTGDQWEWRKGATVGSATPITGYTYSNNASNKVYTKTFAATDAGNYYFFSKTAAGCESYSTVAVTASTPVTPAFTQVTAICSGATLNPLPTTSTNGVTGTWAPALNNTTTTTYTFTPNAGQCATTTTMTITVNPTVTPAFTAVPGICSGGTLSPLPATSTNGITGTWSPALNNTTTTTYTFTPTAGQCATTTTMTIAVNSGNVTPTFTQVAPVCSGGTLSPLPTTSTNGITGAWSPALNNNATTTYTFTPNAGQCATTTTMTITVNSGTVTPTFVQVPPICKGDAVTLQTTSTNGITGNWTPTLNNTTTTTYTFTPAPGQCATVTTMTITVNNPTVPTFNPVNPVCSGTAIAPLPTTSTNGITGTWSPALNNTATTTYTFTPDAGQCATTATLTVTVSTSITPTFTQVAPVCAGAPISALPATSNNGLTGAWSPALDNTTTTTYTFTPDPGQCGVPATMTITVNPIVTPTFNAVAGICSGTTLNPLPTTSTNAITGTWSPALDNTATTSYTFTPDPGQCATTATLSITVSQAPQPPSAKTPVNYCQGETAVQLAASGVNLTWYNNAGSALGSVAPIPSTGTGGTTTYYVTQSNGTCESERVPVIVNIDAISAYAGGPTVYVNEGSTVTLNGTASGSNITITWSPATYLNKTNIITPDVTPQADQKYTLLVQSSDGCKATDEVDVVLLKNLVIPTAFSPNGDGINDRWIIKYIEEYPSTDISIFNRYGQLVFESKGNNSSANGWDGTYQGQPVPVGAYYYVINLGNGKAPLSGSIAVIR